MFFRKRKGSDFTAEVQAHLAFETDRLRAEGLSREQAEAAALRAFGNVGAAEERFYESRCWRWWDEIAKDTRYAIRALRHNPAFTAAAVLTLALGIGANTAMFSVIDGALLRPLPYANPDRVVLLYGRDADRDTFNLAPATFLDFRRQSKAFESLSAFRSSPFNLSGRDRAERIEGAVVTPDFFATLGVQAYLGRALTSSQDPPGGAPTVVLSYSLWQRRYAGDPAILGQAVTIDGDARLVVGVMPPSFRYPVECDAWTAARYPVPEHPLRPDLDQSNIRDSHYFSAIGRLKEGVSIAQANAEAATIAARLKQQYKEEESANAAVVSLRDDLVGDTKPVLWILLGAVSLLLLIACVNVSNLLLARGAARQREMAVRAALGAGRGRLIRQMLTESITLAGAGGGFGILLAYAALPLLRTLLPVDALGGGAMTVDSGVLGFTAALSTGAAVLFGLFPAHQAASFDLNGSLKEGSRSAAAGRRSQRIRTSLVISEVALASVLLIGAGLLIRSLDRLLKVPEGFRAENVLSLRLSLSQPRYPAPGDRARFVSRAIEAIRSLPGVISAAAISRLPLAGGASTRSLDIKGRTLAPGELAPDYLVITPDYFRGMGIPLRRGRGFVERDDVHSPPVVIVNEAAARHFWPGQDPIGQFVQLGGCGNADDWCQVVGIAGDVRQRNLDQQPRPAVFVPYARDPWPFLTLVVRTSADPASATSAVTSALASVDKEQPVYGVRTMMEVVSQSLSRQRARTVVLGLFAFLALTLACVGIYGVISYSVAQRANEIGVRIALGAGRKDVLRLVVGQAFRLSLAGALGGAVLAFLLTRLLAGMLFGVGPTDPPTFIAACGLLVTMTLVSSVIPAARACRTDPIQSLRAQ